MRRIVKFMVLVISILAINLITTHIDNLLISYRKTYSPLIFTLIGMGIIIIIFYPLFLYLDKWVGGFSRKFFQKGKQLFGAKLGVFIAFIIAVGALFFFYVQLWYKIDPFQYLVKTYF